MSKKSLVNVSEEPNMINQSQKTQGFCVADFATLSDERRSRSEIIIQFNGGKRILRSNLKSSYVQKFLGFCKLKCDT